MANLEALTWLILAAAAGVGIVGVVVMAALVGWGGAMTTLQRLGLCGLAAGLVGAGVDRALQRPVGLFDVLFLAALLLYLLASYGPAIARRADAFDGAVDGRLTLHRPRR